MARGDPQTNIRLSQSRYEVLEAAAFVYRTGSPTKLAQQIVDEAIDDYARRETVQKALAARREQAAAGAGKLAHLSAKRRSKAPKVPGNET